MDIECERKKTTSSHYKRLLYNDGAPHHLEYLDGFNPIPKKYNHIY